MKYVDFPTDILHLLGRFAELYGPNNNNKQAKTWKPLTSAAMLPLWSCVLRRSYVTRKNLILMWPSTQNKVFTRECVKRKYEIRTQGNCIRKRNQVGRTRQQKVRTSYLGRKFLKSGNGKRKGTIRNRERTTGTGNGNGKRDKASTPGTKLIKTVSVHPEKNFQIKGWPSPNR